MRIGNSVWRNRTLLALPWLLVLGACDGPGIATHKDAAGAKESVPARPTCRYSPFDEFLRAFQNDSEFQRQSVADPFVEQTVDAFADPEPAVISTTKPRSSVEFPVYPGKGEQAKEGLTEAVELKGDEAYVKLSKPDTDYQFTYHFARRPCWLLLSRSDDSL